MSVTFYTQQEFDEQGSRGFRLGKELALESMIDLLETLKPDDCCEDCKPHAESVRNYLSHIIELIKGENK